MKLREYFKIAEAAEFLGISQNTMRKWADEPPFSSLHAGGPDELFAEEKR